jgi:hypothetical protein
VLPSRRPRADAVATAVNRALGARRARAFERWRGLARSTAACVPGGAAAARSSSSRAVRALTPRLRPA